MRDLTAGQVARFYDHLRTDGRRVRKGEKGAPSGLSERSVKHTHTVLHSALASAVSRRLIARNPLDDLDRDARPHPKDREMAAWSTEEARKFLTHTKGDRLAALWILALSTGMRRGELLGLRWEDVDLEAGHLSVRRARVAAGYEVHEGPPKSGKGRSIALDPGTVAALRRHRKAQREERLARGAAWTDSGYLFVAEDGQPLHPQTSAWFFEKALAGSKVRTIRFHDLRHTHATLALRDGVHPKVVQERLGHSSITITLDLYSHVMPGMQEDAAAKVGAALLAGLG
jgi:integrase